jgi:glutaredoxin 3
MSRVRMFTREGCQFSEKARMFLEEKGIPYDEIDITDDPEEKAAMAEASGGADTTPQIFIDGEHIGGFEDLEEEDRTGRLAAMLADRLDDPDPAPPGI